MKISTKGRYGLRAMIDLATYGKDHSPVFLSDIAKRQEISDKYLEHIFASLHKAGLVKSVRGRKGGYMLNRMASEITLSEILRVLEGPCTLVDCVSDPKTCQKTDICATRDIWAMLGTKIEEILDGITLETLVEKQKEKIEKETIMYHI
ncbi:MAG: Rrf2 family transcriptional regulator [Syntrophorhabdaceae bacterium]|nr:Rrf2 family transcriptional regulator [Syntrophorhabdaceae bacterium]